MNLANSDAMRQIRADSKRPGFVFEVMMEIKNDKHHRRELLRLFRESERAAK